MALPVARGGRRGRVRPRNRQGIPVLPGDEEPRGVTGEPGAAGPVTKIGGGSGPPIVPAPPDGDHAVPQEGQRGASRENEEDSLPGAGMCGHHPGEEVTASSADPVPGLGHPLRQRKTQAGGCGRGRGRVRRRTGGGTGEPPSRPREHHQKCHGDEDGHPRRPAHEASAHAGANRVLSTRKVSLRIWDTRDSVTCRTSAICRWFNSSK